MLVSLMVMPAAAEVDEKIFSADFAYPDCTKEFSETSGSQILEIKDDGLYMTAGTNQNTYAGVPFDSTYNNLSIKLKWRNADVTDASGSKVTNVASDSKYALFLKTDTGNYVRVIHMLSDGKLDRVESNGNPATLYGSVGQPVLLGGFYNIELRFSKNAETGYWWIYFYDLNNDGKQFFSERFSSFTNGATGFAFGSARMSGEASSGHVWKTAISDLNITSGSNTVYKSELRDKHLLDSVNINEGNFDIEQNDNGITLKTSDYTAGSKSELMGFDLGSVYNNFEADFRWKKGYITDSSGNILKDLDRTVSSTYNISLLSDSGNYIPVINMNYMGVLSRVAENSATLSQTPEIPVPDNNDYYNLKLKFGENASDGYWYCYFYDMNDSGKEIYRERFEGFSYGAKGIAFGVSRMEAEVQQGIVWRNTLKNITIYSNDVSHSNIVSDFCFTDGSGNPITIGYGADEINVSFTVSEEIFGTYNLHIYLTGYTEAELKTVQRIPITISENNAGERFTYTFDTCENDMVKKVFLFDNKLMPFVDEVPTLYLINSEENGENVKYVYANTSLFVTGIDYNNIQICTEEGDVCADVKNVYYYPEDELVMIEVNAYDKCPERVRVYGLEANPIDGTA